ncbi:MAG: hemerythrin family protein [Deltaproteobacteria bacterium]|nr:hemerythrin family protein [Deltaproteobacteria bacterium]
MLLQWTEDLSIGNKVIDGQHKELYDRVNAFIEAMQQKKGREEMGGVLDFLEGYIVEHFGTEEHLMKGMAYSGYAAHKAQHEAFKNTFREIIAKYNEKGPTLDIIIMTNAKLGQWLRNHIPVADKELAAFATSRGVAVHPVARPAGVAAAR